MLRPAPVRCLWDVGYTVHEQLRVRVAAGADHFVYGPSEQTLEHCTRDVAARRCAAGCNHFLDGLRRFRLGPMRVAEDRLAKLQCIFMVKQVLALAQVCCADMAG
ncbi:hypothetical protein B0X84_24670 [Salmonella enterica]|nr:hypothetical protein [Salmonella enterica]